jgi:hypothetical protein
LDAGIDEISKGCGEVATVGLGGEQLNVVHNMDRPHIASAIARPHEDVGRRTSAPEEAGEQRQTESVAQAETAKECPPILLLQKTE